ncbi:MAG: hypothetical protein K0S41_4361 [Anaerocolumna sp.]|nr:hypothetical protein [Anaerocolumna sp.]
MSVNKSNKSKDTNNNIYNNDLNLAMTRSNKNSDLKRDQENNTKSQRNNKYAKASERNKYSGSVLYEQQRNNYLIPIIFILAVLPLIVRIKTIHPMMTQYSWLLDNANSYDFFLFYKQWFLVGTTTIMAVIIVHSILLKKKLIDFHPVFIPLSIYGLLALASAIFSKYISISIKGYTDQYESIFVLIGYCIIVYYTYIYVKSENDIKIIVNFLLVSVLILSALGLSQYLEHDFFASEFGGKLITSFKNPADLQFVFGQNRVYLTLFNPNYVGSYVSLILPIFLVLFLFSKNLIHSVLYIIAIIGLAICIIGSQSLTGIVGIVISIIALVIFLRRYLIKRYYISIPVMLVIFFSLFVINNKTDNYMWDKFQSSIKIEKVDVNLKEIKTEADKVTFNYKNNIFNMELVTEGYTSIKITDSNNIDIFQSYDEASNSFFINDERFAGISFGFVDIDEYIGFYVKIDGKDWYFTNQIGDGTYYHFNRFSKLDKIVNPPSAILTEYGKLASGRGYLWSRSIPLLSKYPIIGSGPNTFVMTFPQQDYVGIYNYGYELLTITKPHNFYLQTAIQTGVLSLIALMVFYGMYFISSIILYVKGCFGSYYSQVGVAIFLGTLSYMITGIANDSCITTAPVFWVLIGVGLAVNKKAKEHISEQDSASRAIQNNAENL